MVSSPMKFDLRLNAVILMLLGMLLGIVVLARTEASWLVSLNVHPIEDLQAILLFICVPFTWFYMKPKTLSDGKKWFWLWAMAWWFMFFGRSISWGRDYFPDVPHLYYRIISVIVIAPVFLMLFSSKLRAEIMYKLKNTPLPFWYVLIAAISLIFADSVEHQRLIGAWLLAPGFDTDVAEELYEMPFILGLFFAAFYLMKKDKRTHNRQVLNNVDFQLLDDTRNTKTTHI